MLDLNIKLIKELEIFKLDQAQIAITKLEDNKNINNTADNKDLIKTLFLSELGKEGAVICDFYLNLRLKKPNVSNSFFHDNLSKNFKDNGRKAYKLLKENNFL